MKAMEYFLEMEPQTWSGVRQLHAAGCTLMPAGEQIKSIGRHDRALSAMQQARRIYRKANGCYHCCKA